jgi:hypothetical protein
MAAKKKRPNFSNLGTGPVYIFPHTAAGAYSFSPPASGKWKFVGWGCGGGGLAGTSGGASGAYVEITRFLTKNQVVTISVVSGADTVIAMPDGTVATAGKASAAVAGAASGGDVNLAGTAGVLSGNGNPGLGTGGGLGGTVTTNIGGAGAPANLPFRGGAGEGQLVPAGIGGYGAGALDSHNGLPGIVLAMFIPR